MQAMGRKFWKTPYFQDYEPIFMAESKGDLGKMWIGWRTHHNVWFVYDMEGNAKGLRAQLEARLSSLGWIP